MDIEVKGARVHNLKNIDVVIPANKLVVITGLSGSGKSSLAFDTIYAEGQRRYMETLSSYARQFIGSLERPDVDSITGLSPIIAIEQKTTGKNPRSTVGTITEIYDFLRLLFARSAKAYSPVTGQEMIKYTDLQIVELIQSRYKGKKIMLMSPLIKGRKGHYRDLFELYLKRGYNKVRVDEVLYDIFDVPELDRYKAHFIDLVIDKIIPSEKSLTRVNESVMSALYNGKGSLSVLEIESGAVSHFSKHLVCPTSGLSMPEPAPHTFSFNSPVGGCANCKGLGVIIQADMSKIVPDYNKSIAEGGILPIGAKRDTLLYRQIEGIARKYSFSLNDPINHISDEAFKTIIYGSDELFRVGSGSMSQMMSFPGVIAMIEQSGEESDNVIMKKERYTQQIVCPECNGTRLKREALNFKIDNKNISQLADMDVCGLYDWVEKLPSKLSSREKTIAHDILKELRERLSFLINVGLDYLSLSRSTRSLSGGESQRIRLATQIGSKLVNVTYILDEPSIGLHQRDNIKLIDSLKKLRDSDNSVIVVEHDMEMIQSADWLIDMGPGAGERGGEGVYSGTPSDIIGVERSLTQDYLSGRRSVDKVEREPLKEIKFLELFGASGNNLKSVNLKIPLRSFVVVSGVSGSGKSSLINQTLMPILSNHFYRSHYEPLPYDRIEGLQYIDKLIEVDQSPIGRSPRSNPATYTNLFTDIRKLFGETPDAKIRGFKPGRFSFNIKGGRCETCKGAGVEVIEMNFLPSVYVKCKDCNGKRYSKDTLAVKYKGKNIYEVLEMTISQAIPFFEAIPSIANRLNALESVGLGYIRLGQSSTTLSGGESQRVKLATELSKKSTGNSFYILDEPTTGLHFEDVRVLMNVLNMLVDQGNTVVVIEHNIDVIRCADYIIDMGPNGGQQGGFIVACGTPDEVKNNPKSVTGRYL